jgi:uncharacterized protein (UPF0332 family)
MSKDFEPIDFVYIAAEIIEKIKNNETINAQDKEEGFLRTAISRAYYCVFLTAREKMRRELQKIPKDENVHQAVNRWLAKKNGKKAYDTFFNLRKMRNSADYDLPPNFRADVKVAEMALGLARQLLRAVV